MQGESSKADPVYAKNMVPKHNTPTKRKVCAYFKNCSVFDVSMRKLKKRITKKCFVKFLRLDRHVQGEIRIFVPSKYGYGRSGAAYIPGNTTLVYEVEMITLDNARGERRKKRKNKRKRNKKQRRV